MVKFSALAIDKPDDLRFGVAPRPVKTRRGMVIGGGEVYPELNFTLPPVAVEAKNLPEIFRQYREIITGALGRAAELEANGVVAALLRGRRLRLPWRIASGSWQPLQKSARRIASAGKRAWRTPIPRFVPV